ncbi:hypothetical protein D3C79_675570 [compost metagenome]
MQLQQELDALHPQPGQLRHGWQLGRYRRVLDHQRQCSAQRCQLGGLGFVDLPLGLAIAGKQLGDPLLVLPPAHHAGEPGDQPLAGEAFRHAADQLGGLVGHLKLARLAGEGCIPSETLEHEVGERLSLIQQGLEALLTDLAHQGVRILSIRQEHELEFAPVLQMREGIIQCPPGRLTTGFVTVVAADHLGRGAKQGVDMVAGGSGAQRSHRIVDVVLAERHHVHIAFHHQDPARILVCLLHLVEAKQFSSLVEDGGLRRVEVLGRAIAEHPTTEADDPAALVTDGEHNAIAEAIITAGAAIARDQHAAGDKQLLMIPAGTKTAPDLIPICRGISDIETLDHFPGQTTALKIFDSLGGTLQIALVEAGNLAHQLKKILADSRLCLARPACILLTGHLHALQVGELFDGIGEFESVVLHDKADGVAVGATTETVIKLLLLADGERGAFFVMKRAASLIILAGFFQTHS